ncbi:MAG TPA: ERF family protein [Burkholderiales bacterium]|nr:ERF family protein [Burkholderiales bacterium]
MSDTKHVYAAISAVTAEMAAAGIGKERKNTQQGYSFRGIDDVYNALAGPLARNKLNIIPRVTKRECIERQTQKGGILFYVTVEVEWDIVSAVDGSVHVARTFGEAMDSADKATNKAMSAAYKYMALMLFAIPTEGDNDADATTHEVAARPAPSPLASHEAQLILDSLREAALDGTAALQERFAAIPAGNAKAAVWREHQAALKKAAAQADTGAVA